MARIFLSYSHNDRDFVTRLSQDLAKAGIQFWLDELEIRVGDDIRQKIDQGLLTHEYFGIVLSQSSVSSRWVQQELTAALVKELNSHRVTVLPLKIAEVQIPPLIAGKRYADFVKSYDVGLRELLEVLKAVHMKVWHFPEIDLYTARRGHPEPPQRIAAVMFQIKLIGKPAWTLCALIESIGNTQVAIEATNHACQMVTMLSEYPPPDISDPASLFKLTMALVDFGVKEINSRAVQMKLPKVGTKMAMCLIQERGVFSAKIGSCGGITAWKRARGEYELRRVDQTIRHTQVRPAEEELPTVMLAPLGHLSEVVETEAIETRLESPDDYVALTTYPIPRDRQGLVNLGNMIFDQGDPANAAQALVEMHEPASEDCMCLMLVRSDGTLAV